MCTDKLKAYLAVRGEFLSTLLDADTIQELLKAHPNLIQQILSSSPDLAQYLGACLGSQKPDNKELEGIEDEYLTLKPQISSISPGELCPTCGRILPLDLPQIHLQSKSVDEGIMAKDRVEGVGKIDNLSEVEVIDREKSKETNIMDRAVSKELQCGIIS